MLLLYNVSYIPIKISLHPSDKIVNMVLLAIHVTYLTVFTIFNSHLERICQINQFAESFCPYDWFENEITSINTDSQCKHYKVHLGIIFYKLIRQTFTAVISRCKHSSGILRFTGMCALKAEMPFSSSDNGNHEDLVESICEMLCTFYVIFWTDISDNYWNLVTGSRNMFASWISIWLCKNCIILSLRFWK